MREYKRSCLKRIAWIYIDTFRLLIFVFYEVPHNRLEIWSGRLNCLWRDIMQKSNYRVNLIGCFFCLFLLAFFSFQSNAYPAPSSYYDTVQQIYIGYYQRPADPGGVIYWAGRLDSSGGNLEAIIEAFANSAESQALYGTINSVNISTVVNDIYNALFARDAEAGGRDYFVSGFNSHQFTAATIMLNVLYGAQNEDLQSVNNKLTAANLFTRTIDPELDGNNLQATYAGDGDVIAARNFLALVTSDVTTVPTQSQTTAYIQANIADPGDILAPTSTSTYAISGMVTSSSAGLQGVTMTLSGAGSSTATTDASGSYSFSGLINGNYTVTPTKTDYTFNPISSSWTLNGANIPMVNFTTSSAAPGFLEMWESAILGTRMPENVIKADMGEWIIDDTISGDPGLCGPVTTFAAIVQNTEQNKLLQLTSNHGVSSCAENIWASLGTSIPIVPFTTLSFYEAGSFLSAPRSFPSWCFLPPCNDSIYLKLTDNRGNWLYYVMQYPQNYTQVSQDVPRPYYGEIYLKSLDNLYSRDIYRDFKGIPDFISENARLNRIEFSITANGNAVIDDILIRQATPPPEYSCPLTTCSSFPYVVQSSDTFSDSLGDACFTFIDLKDMTVKVDNATVTVTISVASIPSVFQFNQPGVPTNYLEYEWAVYFDINNDNALNGDIKMALQHYKYSNSSFEGSLLDNLEKSVRKYTSNTSSTYIGPLTAQLSGDTFTISVDKSIYPDLSAITNSTKVRFSAGYYYPYKSKFYRDTYPDCF